MFFFFIKLCNIVFQQPGWFVETSASFLKILYYFFAKASFSLVLAEFLQNLLLKSNYSK
jgi:hypothetical protein